MFTCPICHLEKETIHEYRTKEGKPVCANCKGIGVWCGSCHEYIREWSGDYTNEDCLYFLKVTQFKDGARTKRGHNYLMLDLCEPCYEKKIAPIMFSKF